ncbi:MAG: DUF3410 domain-containing protein, partial [Porticoccaceae bacterium]|nr:DUF3410 domain-containing protein [Porticoccaceae bacterium]
IVLYLFLDRVSSAFELYYLLYIPILGLLMALSLINIGHELVHRTSKKFDCEIGNWALATAWNPAFAIEHVYGHHKNIGIVGCGNVGGLLFRTLKALDVNCHVYDPFLNNDDVPLSDFDSVLRCDIVCLHTPLTYDGPFPTHHLFDQNVLNRLNSSALLINAGRGDVVDKAALLRLLNTQSELQVALDVWSDEPQIDLELLHKISIGTPHIAGYSREGKINGTKMIFEAFTEWLPKTVLIEPYEPLNYVEIACQRTHSLSEILLASYNVLDDDLRMRQSLLNISEELGSAEVAAIFDDLRKTYPTRIQYDWTIISSDGEAFSGEQRDQLQKLGFKLTDNL